MIERARRTLALPFLIGIAGSAQAQEPLSASDWLSGSVRNPPRESSAWRPGTRPPPTLPGRTIDPVAESGAVGDVAVSRLDRPDPDTSGTLGAADAALPDDLWNGSQAEDVARLIAQTPTRLPAMDALMQRLLLVQSSPPAATDATRGAFFLARVDRLLATGHLSSARALLHAAGTAAPEAFRRLFDIALLQGNESQACDLMDRTPGIAPSIGARIFCLAHSGDWSAAALTMHGAEALNLIEPERVTLLHHFLDDSYVDRGETLDPPDPVTPLDFRMHEAIGQPLPTASLPLAFAHSDLRDNGGWKARIEAAERLARQGAIPPDRLRRIYAEQQPAASGGVWDRAATLQAYETALAGGDPLSALPAAFDAFASAGMGGVLATLIGAEVEPLSQQSAGRGAEIAGWLAAWQGLTRPADLPGKPLPSVENAPQMPKSRLGEALLSAMADVDAGLDGDEARAANGIAMLRALGLGRDADLAETQLRLAPQMMSAIQSARN
ncbi:hypothetical protein MLD63_15675 [Paracoccus sp. TK19116]|uniref:Secreted protein n=1 Tax=Paracoccus albicereus TaxID=2922394 RepID=A0ABT1MUH7_9RHOB|nr:hypothetical protein [Paracoccus albicereus]MCQ0971861.1 hypothetical protein [Paracoccus albicereus]